MKTISCIKRGGGVRTCNYAPAFALAAVLTAAAGAAAAPVLSAGDIASGDIVLTENETVDGTLRLAPGTTIDLAGHALDVKGVRISSPAAAEPALIASEASFWLDAAAAETLTVDGNGVVTRWASRTGNNAASVPSGKTGPLLVTSNGLSGSHPAYCEFGAVLSGRDMVFDGLEQTRTVFLVVRIKNSAGPKYAFWLCNTTDFSNDYPFHRGENGKYYSETYSSIEKMWNGGTLVSADAVPDESKFHVITIQTKTAAKINSLTNDRDIPTRNSGGKALCELICFDRTLTDEERGSIETYLQAKWAGGSATILDSAAAGAAPGELHVEVADGTEILNDGLALGGNLKFVKEGEGTWTAALAGQTYSGGTEIAEGTILATVNDKPLGAVDSPVKVCSGATLDLTGLSDFGNCFYAYDLAGTLRVECPSISCGYSKEGQFLGSSLTLSGDATIAGRYFYFAKCNAPATRVPFTMNGHVLTFETTGYIGLGGVDVGLADSGKIVFAGGENAVDPNSEWIQGGDVPCAGGSSVDIEVAAPNYLKLGRLAIFNARNFAYSADKWARNDAANIRVNVYGAYKAGATRPPLEMKDGSTLDLSEVSGTLDTRGIAQESQNVAIAATSANGSVAFESGATVNVALDGRDDLKTLAKSASPYLLSWAAAPDADFALAGKAAERYRLVPEAAGLRLAVRPGLCVIIR